MSVPERTTVRTKVKGEEAMQGRRDLTDLKLRCCLKMIGLTIRPEILNNRAEVCDK